MKERAADWFKALNTDQTATFATLLEAFKEKFALTDLQRMRRASVVWQRKQQPLEAVGDYITDITRAAKQLGDISENQIIIALTNGFKPDIRRHVIQQDHKTLKEVIKDARIAEESVHDTAGTDGNTMGELTRVVASLVDRLDKQSTPSVVHHGDVGNQETLCSAMGDLALGADERAERHEQQDGRRSTSGSGQRQSSQYQRRPSFSDDRGASPQRYANPMQ